jgi:hypothetical protein
VTQVRTLTFFCALAISVALKVPLIPFPPKLIHVLCVCVSHPTTTMTIHFSSLNIIAYTMRNSKEWEPPLPLTCRAAVPATCFWRTDGTARRTYSCKQEEVHETKSVAVVTMKDKLFWNVTPCSLVDWQTSVTCLLGVSTLKMEALHPCQTSTKLHDVTSQNALICLKRPRLWSIIKLHAHILVSIVPGLWDGDRVRFTKGVCISLRAYKRSQRLTHPPPNRA